MTCGDVGMAVEASTESGWPETAPSRASGMRRFALASALGFSAAALTTMLLPDATFHARAVVEVADLSSPLASVLPGAVAGSVVSEPVMRRAAESLIGTGMSVRDPGVFERLTVATGLEGARATGRASRLAADLTEAVAANPGETLGTLDISARASDAERAAQMASAAAQALVAEQDDQIAKARRKRDMDFGARLARLQIAVLSARQKLAALGGVAADPEQMRGAAAAQVAEAQARVEAMRAILASGTPPLADRRSVPSSIESLQAAYLDLTRQLAKARETLGDRHTTIISLQAEVRHAAAALTSEWRRLSRLAESELAAAKRRELALRKADTPAEAVRREAIADARRAVQAAEETLAGAQTQKSPSADERSYRLLSSAAMPTRASGLSLAARSALALLVGLVVLVGALRRRVAPETAEVAQQTAPVLGVRSIIQETEDMAERQLLYPIRRPVSPRLGTQDVVERREERREERRVETDADLLQSMVDLLPRLDAIAPQDRAVPTVIVASNEADAGTMSAAVALGQAAAESGHRVLLVEARRTGPRLAAMADVAADPILIDVYGTLRVALAAEVTDAALYLAPSFEGRIASALMLQGCTSFVEDLADEFDLVVIDGDRADDCAEAGWSADVFIRVGRFASRREDERLAATFHAPSDALLGTIVSSAFTPRAVHKTPRPSVAAERQRPQRPLQAAGPYAPTFGQASVRRKVGMR